MTLTISRSNAPFVSIIIPATARLELLLACLNSLARFAPSDIPFETIVVLNNATADKLATLYDAVSGIDVVASPDNLGAAGAVNQGRARARGKYLMLLHDDAEIEQGCLETLIGTAERQPRAGAIGCKVLDPSGELQNAGMILWRDGRTSPPWPGKPPPADAFAELRAVDYCGSNSLLVRASAFDAAGGLDERFYPAYYVDVDLAMALRQLGYVVLYQPAARVRHHRGASMNPRFRSFLAARNRELFIQKWQAALSSHEPFDPPSQQAIARAIARAQTQAATVPAAADGLPTTNPPPFDTAAQEVRLLRLRCAMQEAYIDDLSSELGPARRFRAQRYINAFRNRLTRWRSGGH